MNHLSGMGYRIIQELSLHSREKRKVIAKRLRVSPQLISYTISRIEEQRFIEGYTLNLDPARFGLITIYVFLSYTKFEKGTQKKVISHFMNDEYVVTIEELSHGADLLVEYCVPNLSFFNKRYESFREEYADLVEVLSLNPVIVKHQFSRDYLTDRTNHRIEDIYSGDREPAVISDSAQAVLQGLWKDPQISAQQLASKTSLNIGTVLKILQQLGEERVIRSFSIIPHFQKMGIESAILFISTKNLRETDIRRLISFSLITPEIVSVIKLIGQYGIVVKIESLTGYGPVLDALRREVSFYDYLLYDVRNILKNTYVPFTLLTHH